MSAQVLVAWIGNTDLRVSRGELRDSLGPIGLAVRERKFPKVHLLSDHSTTDTKNYSQWLKKLSECEVATHHVQLTGPTRFGEIYEAAVIVLHELRKSGGDNLRFVYHLSPGTPAMAAVWILLAKTIYTAELIESSAQHGVRTVSLPFEISAEYLPHLVRPDDEILQLTQGLPPEVSEFGAIVHRSQVMQRLIVQARRIAVHDVPVLIQGESGTGKELFARAIHASSNRSKAPFIEVNCGAIPAELVESMFFGHAKGVFTGATQARSGYIEEADGGTLFLDEIGELPLAAQVKLLRVLQEGSVQRLGTSKPKKVDFRVIAATNRNLLEEVAMEKFREDLFHRLAIGVLLLPPLRERVGDIGPLVDYAMERINAKGAAQPGWVYKKVSASARNLLNQHPWPGNVRELFNTLSRTAIWAAGDSIQGEDIQQALFPVAKRLPTLGDSILNRSLGNGLDLPGLLADVARHYLKRAIAEAKGNKSQACKLVGLQNYQTFTNWMQKYGVDS
jgi:DNA-binding NtrC family response regulator